MTARTIAACLLAFLPSGALAVADGPDHFTTRNLAKGESLTVRLAPSMEAAAAGRIPAGTSCIRNLGCRVTSDSPPAGKAPPETWCEVQSGKVKGFALARYLAEGTCDATREQAATGKAIKLTGGQATATGEIFGDKDATYRVAAGAGQKLTVAIKASNPQAYFNVSAPGSVPVAMFNGSMGGDFEGVVLPDDGEYAVTVYLMRAAARRNERASYTLTVKLGGKALMAVPAAQDALVKGTRYHAKAPIPCTPPYGLKVPCEAGAVRRTGTGAATVDIALGKDLRRRILFVDGMPIASDSASALKYERKGDDTVVSIDDERYTIPDALIGGG